MADAPLRKREREYRPDIRLRLEIGSLAVVLAFSILVGWDWPQVLLGWGLSETMFAARDAWRYDW